MAPSSDVPVHLSDFAVFRCPMGTRNCLNGASRMFRRRYRMRDVSWHDPQHWPEYRDYAAFVSDPDGNNIEVLVTGRGRFLTRPRRDSAAHVRTSPDRWESTDDGALSSPMSGRIVVLRARQSGR